MISPLIEQLVAGHIEELRQQAAQPRPADRKTLLNRSHGASQRVKSRLGSYLVDRGQRLMTTSTPHAGNC
jgi:hypothetical protein